MKTLPKGFKNSEIGPVPKDWEVKELGEMFIQILGGGTPSRVKVEYWHGDLPWATVKDISNFSPIDTQEHISSDAVKGSSTRIIPAGTLIVTMRMSIGKVVIYQVDVAINQDLKALVVCDHASVAYTKYVIESISGSLEELASGSTVKGLPLTVFTKYLVSVPPLSEQVAIATALSDIDALISAQEELLAKKRAIKQGAMQELLTGRRRLPGFPVRPMKQTDIGPIPEDWEVKGLNEICSMQSGQAITAKDIDDTGSFPCYGGNGLRGYTKTYTHDGMFPLIGRQGALCGNTKFATGKFYASEHAVVVSCMTNTSPLWLYYTLDRMNLNQYAEASAQPGLAVSKIMRQYIAYPCVSEQEAIAAVLSDMDAEITAVEEELAKHRALKRGMMQELLSGRIRLPYKTPTHKKQNAGE